MTKEKFLLHICCAPCSPYPIRELKRDYDLTLFFYNPNIHPEGEYLARLADAEKLSAIESTPLVAGEYRHDEWLAGAGVWRDEPERGRRCEFCIGMRLDETAKKAEELGIRLFGSVLSISRIKSTIMINGLGEKAMGKFAGIEFHPANWKKKDGETTSNRISETYGLRRQTYCGCEFGVHHEKHEKARKSETPA
ncbi:MAG: epoxyqueuosine reductase QueH [Nitrospinae bacterium]|nr:epoxyqueuosine reductase QueH [Nitrospinota bacterium]